MGKLYSKAKGMIIRNYEYAVLLAITVVSLIFMAPSFAMAADMKGVLTGMGTIGAVVVGVAAIAVLIMEVPKIAKGEKAVGGTLAKVGILLLIAGLIMVATNMDTLANTFKGTGQGLTDVVKDAANQTVGGK